MSRATARQTLVNRRDFLSLCGLVAGSCLVPDAIARVIRDTCVLAEQPYLILPRDPGDVLYALTELFKQFGAIELNVALTALIIGSSLLLLSAFWHQAREAVVKPLPESLRAKLPVLDRSAVASPPAA